MKYNVGHWYWFTHPQEGDVWYPVFIQSEEYFMMDGEHHPIKNLDQAVVVKAVMPDNTQ